MDAAAFLAAAAAASLAAPEPLDFVGLVRGGLFFLEFLEEAAVVADFFLLVRTSESLSLLSLKILLYLSTVFKFDAADLEEVATVVLLVVDEAVVGVDEGLTEGEACDPGDEDAAIAAFLACCALAASLGSE